MWSLQGHPEVSDNTVVPSVLVSTGMPVRVPQSTATPPAHSETVQQRPVSETGSWLTMLTSTGLRGPRDDENRVLAEPRHLREGAHLSGWFHSEDSWTTTVAVYIVGHPAEPLSVTLCLRCEAAEALYYRLFVRPLSVHEHVFRVMRYICT